ncbi:hypothetical protein A8U91_00110 [Halomonas elongata]|uniref:Uncharacterized protein n=1 Tax=Halomonas elongata TaxID=2746 RepID=A0A1B8P0J6_HALEL|nr:hypothetical protein A8U91_00110 [Halomonas elongata]
MADDIFQRFAGQPLTIALGSVKSQAVSSKPRARRASPAAARASRLSTSSSTAMRRAPRPRVSSASARRSTSTTSSSVSALRTCTLARDSRAELTSKEGFSVVAPISVSRPDSTWGSRASCWLLLSRWISSRNSRVPRSWPWATRARSTASRMSLTPAITAERRSRWAPDSSASISARVVLPVPGGPHRIIERTVPVSTMRLTGLSGPTSACWPT